MKLSEITDAVRSRYDSLSQESCCLSCGSAISYGEARPGEVCVDLGSGQGRDALRLADQVGDRGHVYGIDTSEGMLKKASAAADRLGVRNVSFLQADLQALPLESASVDLVISNCTINHAADKQAVWNEIFRILAPGGRFVVSDIYATKEVPAKFANDPAAVAECWEGSVTRSQYFGHLARAGFGTVDVREESEPYAKGEVEVVSMTIAATKPGRACCC
ncbi:MAG TPA: methyltransferase domain-containing protein [Spirochaetia bacterium]|nr:methyltransferase domain-containing protein [Spirochaetia bacterium]